MPSERYNPGYTPSLDRRAVAGAYVNPYEDLLSAIEKGAEKVAGVAAQDLAQDRVFSGQQPGLTLGLTDVQRRYNDAAQAAYEARTEGQVRAKAAELGAKYTGLNPTDPQRFAEEFDAFAGAVTGSLPEQMRARIGGEMQVRRDYLSAQILDSANRHELKRNSDAIELGWKQYVDDAASAAQLGNDELADAALMKAAEKQQQLVALGLISPETAALNDRAGREEVATRTIFRGFMEGRVSLDDVLSGRVGGPTALSVDAVAAEQKRLMASDATQGELGIIKHDGGWSHEVSVTAENPAGEGFANYPLLVQGQSPEAVRRIIAGNPSADDYAVAARRAAERVAQGASLPSYPTVEEAEAAAQRREAGWQSVAESGVGGLSASARDRLVNRIQGEISDRRVAANHALALEERGLRLRSQDATGLAKKLDAGVPLSPDEQARADSYATTPGLLEQDALDKISVSRATSGLSRQVATATPQQIEATIAEWNTRPPGTLADVEFRKRAIDAFEARQAALKDDPAAYAASVMPDKFPPVVLPSPGDPGFDAALQQAASNATLIRSQFGVDANPFTREQQQRLATELASMPASEQAATLQRIQANMGATAATVHEGLAKDGALVQAHAGLVPAPIAASILRGQEQLKLGNVKAPTVAEASSELIDSGIAEAYSYSPGAQAQLRQAATARAAYLAAMAGDPAGAAGYLAQAYKDVGGTTGVYAGRKIALPLGVEDLGVFSDRIESVTPEEVAAMGGSPDVAAALRAGEAALESIGNGQYLVTIGTSRANRADGRPFILDFSGIAEKAPRRPVLQLSTEAVGFDPSGR